MIFIYIYTYINYITFEIDKEKNFVESTILQYYYITMEFNFNLLSFINIMRHFDHAIKNHTAHFTI